ncbi:MAG: SpoIIE family protein phosphatase [Eubacteriaceae bacterium]
MSDVYLREFKNAMSYQLKEMNNQIQLTLEDINCPVRNELGHNIDLAYMRILRVALRDTFGSKLSNALLFEAGSHISTNLFHINDINMLIKYLDHLMIGKTRIVHMDNRKIIIEEDECAVCSGFPDIGEALCSFESGFISGALSDILNTNVSVTETKCWGLGDKVCRFEAVICTRKDNVDNESKIDTVDLIATLASKTSMVIELNKQLKQKNDIFNKQLEFAQNIQKKIIPRSNRFKSQYVNFYSYLKPFRKVGGDFYDFFLLDSHKVSITIADMTGHGIDAAMITSMVKLILKHCSKRKGLLKKPQKVIEFVEKDIEEVIPDNFFSMMYLVIDPMKKSIEYCNAGHPSAILFRKKQNIFQMLHPNKPLVGLSKYMPDGNTCSTSVLYESGDQLFLYTDGIPETRNTSRQFYNTNRLLDIIRKSHTLSIDEVCHNIISSIDEFRNGNDEEDDVCLLGIQL